MPVCKNICLYDDLLSYTSLDREPAIINLWLHALDNYSFLSVLIAHCNLP